MTLVLCVVFFFITTVESLNICISKDGKNCANNIEKDLVTALEKITTYDDPVIEIDIADAEQVINKIIKFDLPLNKELRLTIKGREKTYIRIYNGGQFLDFCVSSFHFIGISFVLNSTSALDYMGGNNAQKDSFVFQNKNISASGSNFSLTNCSFSSDELVARSFFFLENVNLTITNGNFQKLKFKEFMVLSSGGTINLFDCQSSEVEGEYFIRGVVEYLGIENSNFTSLKVRQCFINLGEFSLILLNKTRFVNSEYSNFSWLNGTKYLINEIIMISCQMDNLNVNRTTFILAGENMLLNIIESNFTNFKNFQKSDILIISLALFNKIAILKCAFRAFSNASGSLITLLEENNEMYIEKATFEDFNCKMGLVLFNVSESDCNTTIVESRFSKINLYQNVFYQFFMTTLVVYNATFVNTSFLQTSSIVHLDFQNRLLMKNANFTYVSDITERPNDEELGFTLYAEADCQMFLLDINIEKVELSKTSKFFGFYRSNSIRAKNLALRDVIINDRKEGCIFELFYKNSINIFGRLELFNISADSLNSMHLTFNNQIYFIDLIFNIVDARLIMLLNDDKGANNISITNTTMLFSEKSKIGPFIKIVNKTDIFISGLSVEAIALQASVVLLSNNSVNIEIENTVFKGLLKDDEALEKSMFKFNVNQKISLKNFTISEIKNYDNIITIQSCDDLLVQSSYFGKNEFLNAGSLFNISGKYTKVTIENCKFEGNTNYIEGVLQIEIIEGAVDNSIIIKNNSFEKNAANTLIEANRKFSRGGCVYFKSFYYKNLSNVIKLEKNIFAGNTASIGPVLFFEFDPTEYLNISGNKFDTNSAELCMETLEGGDMASLFKSFIFNNSQLNTIKRNEPLFRLKAVDFFGNNFSYFDNNISNIYNNSNANYTVDIVWTRDLNYEVRIRKISLEYYYLVKTKENDFIEINSNVTFTFMTISQGLNYTYQIPIKVKIQCEPGKFFKNEEFDCFSCPNNTMKLIKNLDLQCELCSKNKYMKRCYGDNKTILKEGFYKSDYSPLIFRCKNIKACNQTNNSKCGEKYDDRFFLCSKCTEGNGMTLGWECIDCSSPASYFAFIISISITIFLKAYSVRKAYKLTRNLKKKKEKRLKLKSYTIFNLATTNSCLKIINIHLSFIFSLYSYPFGALDEMRSNSGSKRFFLAGWIVDSFNFSIECFLKNMGLKSLSHIYLAIFTRICQPIIIIVIWIVYYSVKIYLKKRSLKNANSNRSRVQSTAGTPSSIKRHAHIYAHSIHHKSIFFYNLVIEEMKKHSLESITLIALSITYEDVIMGLSYDLFYFDSKENDSPSKRLLHEPSKMYDENSSTYKIPLYIILLVIFGLLVPLYIILRLRNAKALSGNTKIKIKLNSSQVEMRMNPLESYKIFVKYGYFFYQYKKTHYFYEIFYMFKRVVYLIYNVLFIPLIAIHTKYDDNIALFINFEVILIWMFYLIHSYTKPFRSELKEINSLESLSAILLLTSYFFSALFFNNFDPEYSNDTKIEIVNYFLFFGIGVLNFIFFVYAFRILYKSEKENMIGFYYYIKSYVCCFIKVIPLLCLWCFTCSKRSVCRKIKYVKTRYTTKTDKNKLTVVLNPLASWKSRKTSEITFDSDVNEKEVLLVKSLTKRIQNLKLLVLYQKKEINKLRSILEGNTVSHKTQNVNYENLESELGMNESVRMKHINEALHPNLIIARENLKKKFREPNTKISSLGEIIVQEEKTPAEIELGTYFVKIPNSLDYESSKEIMASSGQKDKENESSKNFPEKKYEDGISAVIVKKIFGSGHQDYFIKTKMTLKNHFESVQIKDMRKKEGSDVFLHYKKQLTFPCFLTSNNCLQTIFYVRHLGYSKDLVLTFELQISNKEKTYFKPIHIKYEGSDFVCIAQSNMRIDPFLNLFKIQNNSKLKAVSFHYSKIIGPYPNKEKILEVLKQGFPEFYRNVQNPFIVETPLIKFWNNKCAKKLGVKDDWKQRPRGSSFGKKETEQLAKSGKLLILHLNLQLNIELCMYDKQAQVTFEDISHPSKEVVKISEMEIKQLLDSFLDGRLS